MTTTRWKAAAALAAATTLLLTACTTPEAAPPVAALPSTPAASAAATPPATSTATPAPGAADPGAGDRGYPLTGEPPQLRLDDPPERQGRLVAMWDLCLLDNGATPAGEGSLVAGIEGRDLSKIPAEPIPDTAKAACAHLLPRQPVELSPDTNPRYRESVMAWVACLRDNGIMVHAVDDSSGPPGTLTWTYDEGATSAPDPEGKIDSACMMTAFGGDS
jgi:hypothetical protein